MVWSTVLYNADSCEVKGAVFSFYSATEGLGRPRSAEVILWHLTLAVAFLRILKQPFFMKIMVEDQEVKNATKIQAKLITLILI